MKEINYQFRERMSEVHKPNRRDFSKKLCDGQIEIDDSWSITIPDNADIVIKNAARDLEDYFFVSMGISLKVSTSSKEISKKRIVYSKDSSIPANSYRLKVTEEEISLVGVDSRMAAQAGYFIEDLMNLCEAPFLDKQDITRTSLFNPRMVHSGYGLDMFPREHLLNIAHSGIGALLIFVKGIDLTPHGYQDFNDICRRAAEFGLDVYAYSYLANKLHPEDDGAEEFYENLYGTLFDRCPYFKGIIFVGESCEFPSKDPNTTGIRRLDNIGPDGKPLVTGKPHPGWWPCYDYTIWLELIQKIIYKRRPDADIVFWSYNWNRVDAQNRKALVDTLPKDITLQATYEMGHIIERDGIENRPTDYTIFFEGPSYYFTTEGESAKENGLRFYSMTNTGGLTWDVGVIPYVPAPYQWMKRYKGMLEAQDKYGLVGTMDSHHYGFYPSFISDLAKWAFYSPAVDLEEALHNIAARDFSYETRDSVCEAYKLFSDGIYHMISTNADQYGPCRIGPSYPFVLFDDVDIQIPTTPYAHFGGNAICFPIYGMNMLGGVLNNRNLLANEELVKKYNYEIENFRKTADLYDMGCKLLEDAISKIPEKKRDNALRILGIGKFIRNTARTAANVKEFFKRKEKLLASEGKYRNLLVDEMIEICKSELENAKDTIPLVEFDSRLGYEPSMEYMCDPAHLEWKIEQLTRVIERELPSYYQ